MTMKWPDIQDLPPTAKAEAFMLRERMTQELARSAQQRAQAEQLSQKLLLKTKRRARKQQKRR
jgi:hypothetical protein